MEVQTIAVRIDGDEKATERAAGNRLGDGAAALDNKVVQRIGAGARDPEQIEIVICVCAVFTGWSAWAGDIDPLWLKAQTLLKANQGLIAADIQTSYGLDGGDEHQEGNYSVRLDGSVKADKPVRALVDASEKEKSQFKLAKL